MEIFGLSIIEILTILGSAVALIITISRAGKRDTPSESVDFLLDPLNQKIEELQTALSEKDEEFDKYIRRSQRWKTRTTRRLNSVIDDMESLKKDFEQEVTDDDSKLQ